MDFEEFCRKTDEISNLSRGTQDEARKKQLTEEYFDVAIDFFNEHMTGDVKLADGGILFIPAIEN
jgi:hypothetical protein